VRTMIQIDPDLSVLAATPLAKSQSKTKAAPGQEAAKAPDEKLNRLPSTRTLEKYLLQAQQAVRLRGEVSVLLSSDANIKRMNRQFRQKNKATDVLSFPAMDLGMGPASERLAGDLAISVETARRQAASQGHSLTIELKVLLLHGLLHLAGYDHEADEGQMARREQKLRALLKLPLGLIERVEGSSPAARAVKTPATKKAAVKKAVVKKAAGKTAAKAKSAAKVGEVKLLAASKSTRKRAVEKKTAVVKTAAKKSAAKKSAAKAGR